MKDDKDNATIDGIPKKMGRPLTFPGKGPMSSAERQRIHRKKIKEIEQNNIDAGLCKLTAWVPADKLDMFIELAELCTNDRGVTPGALHPLPDHLDIFEDDNLPAFLRRQAD